MAKKTNSVTRTELYSNINALNDEQLVALNNIAIAMASGKPLKNLVTAPAPVKSVTVYTAQLSGYTRKFSGIHKSATKDYNGTWDKGNSFWFFAKKSERDNFVKAQKEYDNTLVKGEATLEQ